MAEFKDASASARFLFDKFKPPINTWECSVCMIRNHNDLPKCAACESSKPESIPKNASVASYGFGSKFAPPPNTWECQSCMIRNKDEVEKCAACETDRLKTSDSTLDLEKRETEWDCKVCTLRNKSTTDNCLCCESHRSGAPSALVDSNRKASFRFSFGTGTAAGSSFAFGLPAQSQSSTGSTTGSFVFGEKPEVTADTPTFNFGLPNAPPTTIFPGGQNHPMPFPPRQPMQIHPQPRYIRNPLRSGQIKETIKIPSPPAFNFAPTQTNRTAHENQTYSVTDIMKAPSFNFRFSESSTLRQTASPLPRNLYHTEFAGPGSHGCFGFDSPSTRIFPYHASPSIFGHNNAPVADLGQTTSAPKLFGFGSSVAQELAKNPPLPFTGSASATPDATQTQSFSFGQSNSAPTIGQSSAFASNTSSFDQSTSADPVFGSTNFGIQQPTPFVPMNSTNQQQSNVFGKTNTLAQLNAGFGQTSSTAQHPSGFGQTAPFFGFGSKPTDSKHEVSISGLGAVTANQITSFGCANTSAPPNKGFNFGTSATDAST